LKIEGPWNAFRGEQYQGPEVSAVWASSFYPYGLFRRVPYAFPSFTIKSNTKVLQKVQFLSTHLSNYRKKFTRTRAAQFTYKSLASTSGEGCRLPVEIGKRSVPNPGAGYFNRALNRAQSGGPSPNPSGESPNVD